MYKYLDQAKVGDRLEIVSTDAVVPRLQMMRLGLHDGSEVTVLMNTNKGVTVLSVARQEIAIGYGLAQKVRVKEAQK